MKAIAFIFIWAQLLPTVDSEVVFNLDFSHKLMIYHKEYSFYLFQRCLLSIHSKVFIRRNKSFSLFPFNFRQLSLESKKCSKQNLFCQVLVLSCGQTNILHTHTKKRWKGSCFQLCASYRSIHLSPNVTVRHLSIFSKARKCPSFHTVLGSLRIDPKKKS